ncbi:hypothetical protein J8L97_02715 [Pseudoalteromonas sp. MMG012]|nr:hypothetical protein [Pseudoalteromonas sp. MMG012]
MRSKWLLIELYQQGANLTLILDKNGKELSKFYSELKCNVICIQDDVESDEQHTIEAIQDAEADFLLVDHYELGIDYERAIRQAVNCQIIVLDDLAREHDCDYLIDAKWETVNTNLRYRGKLPAKCQQFLGPKYAFLSEQYTNISEINIVNYQKFTIMCSLGGSGDMAIWVALIQALPEYYNERVDFTVIIGPQAKNIGTLKEFAAKKTNVKLIEQPKSLALFYKLANLFIGALGTSLYELAALKVPAFTFSIAYNQRNDILCLEALGHYFHLEQLTIQDAAQLGENLPVLLQNIHRLRRLRTYADIKVDGLGVKRIAAKINQRIFSEHLYEVHAHDDNHSEHLSGGFSIRKVVDSDINRYLMARNLPNNANRMTISEEIPRLGHYIWWFKNQRHSYVVEKEGRPTLFIWHDIYQSKYLYGGWFTCGDEVTLPQAMLALQWQLQYCKKKHPDAVWLAVIHKENKFVNLLNQYMGFTTTDMNSEAYQKTQAIFPYADEQFNFVMLENNEY